MESAESVDDAIAFHSSSLSVIPPGTSFVLTAILLAQLNPAPSEIEVIVIGLFRTFLAHQLNTIITSGELIVVKLTEQLIVPLHFCCALPSRATGSKKKEAPTVNVTVFVALL